MRLLNRQTIFLPTVIPILLTVLVIALLIGYVLFQARLMIAGPTISLTKEPSIVQSERQVVLTGEAENITSITLNDRPIVTTEDGVFTEQIILENGYNVVSLKAKDRYGRETLLQQEFVYTPLSLYQPIN